jgi:hypothetical protein
VAGKRQRRYTRRVADHRTLQADVLFSPRARAFVAFQLVDHWGNRTTPRPRPRAEVLAATLLLGSEGRGEGDLAEESIPKVCADLAAEYGRYVAYLLSRHCTRNLGEAHPLLAAWRSLLPTLEREPRYRAVFASHGDAANRAILAVSHALAAHLLSGGGDTSIADLPQVGGPVPLRVVPCGERTYRLRPWPLWGYRLAVHAEGSLPGGGSCLASWTLLAPSAPAD